MTEEIIETPVTEIPAEPKPDSLSNRDALQHALDTQRDAEPAVKPEIPTAKEVKAAVAIDVEPPAEFNKAERDAWVNKDIAGIQKGYRRVSDSRTQEIGRAQTERNRALEEAKTAKEFMASVSPYIEERLIGDGVPKEKAALDAIRLAHALRTDKKTAKIELEKLGFRFAVDDDAPAPKIDDTKINDLQTRLNRIEEKEKAQNLHESAQVFGQVFGNLAALKTRTGETVFPDLLDDSEAGIQLATRVGSRTRDQQFQEMVLRRFPGADYHTLVREAYVWEGGRVAGTPSSESPKNNSQHTQKARRAAASTPGGVVSRSGTEALIGKLGNRAAMKKALELSKEH